MQARFRRQAGGAVLLHAGRSSSRKRQPPRQPQPQPKADPSALLLHPRPTAAVLTFAGHQHPERGAPLRGRGAQELLLHQDRPRGERRGGGGGRWRGREILIDRDRNKERDRTLAVGINKCIFLSIGYSSAQRRASVVDIPRSDAAPEGRGGGEHPPNVQPPLNRFPEADPGRGGIILFFLLDVYSFTLPLSLSGHRRRHHLSPLHPLVLLVGSPRRRRLARELLVPERGPAHRGPVQLRGGRQGPASCQCGTGSICCRWMLLLLLLC